jgi:hypothetical protein
VTSYDEALARRVAESSSPGFLGGSSYFAPRGLGLDPHLFDADGYIQPVVRTMVLSTLYRYLAELRLANARSWSRVWFAGSGITTAWDSDREAGGAPGDLDTLLGVDYQSMRQSNPDMIGSPDDAIASWLNQTMHAGLWPKTDHAPINGRSYELTYYVNPGVGSAPGDILSINPYAAYDLTGNVWTLEPLAVPDGFNDSFFSPQARERTQEDHARALGIQTRFYQAKAALDAQPDPARARNQLVDLHDIIRYGAEAFDSIHDGRHAAFAAGGKGFFDDANYRWQAGKGNGTVTALRFFKQLDEAAHRDVFGGEDSTEHLLLTAALANGR